MMGKKAFEVSTRLFTMLTMGKETPYLIQGNPAVFIYPEGQMTKHQTIDTLTIDDLMDLRAAKAKKEGEKNKAQKEAFKKDLLEKIDP